MRTRRILFFFLISSFVMMIFKFTTILNQESELLHREYHKMLVQASNIHFNDGNNEIKYNNEKQIEIEKVSIKDHMKFYKLDDNIHYGCSNVSRPVESDVIWWKTVYQKITLKFGDYPENDVFAMKFYYDDRFLSETGQRHIRGIVTVHGPGHTKSIVDGRPVLDWAITMNHEPWLVQLWYEGFQNPIGVKCKLQAGEGLIRNASNMYFFQQIITCIVPEIGIMPVNASIVRHPCSKPITNIEIVYPDDSHDHSNRKIGVCMASLFGNLSSRDVPYFVNWMEALNIFGIDEVTMNNASLTFEDDVIDRAFKYYQDIGRLTFTHYPPVQMRWDSPKEDDAASEGINKITVGDCIYRNIKRYWYVLIIDMDELPVPTHFDTYQEHIEDYIRKHPNLTHAHCLSVRSAFFYRDQPPGNSEYGKHLPILRLTKRFRVEPFEVDGVGLSKSFHNVRNMVAAGHHVTRQTHFGGGPKHIVQEFMPEKDILIHHYRSSCKYKHYCRDYWNETIHDDILPTKYGSLLQQRVENVLKHIDFDVTD